ncbi:alpha/beta fold hydrolase [Andreprevotia chitinilytica]|uniref:alpha/beta fold hydrolase n=1 Tax=Andreprevotia chitinilytica TaxID=396808 RepID=UPI000558CB56|nr:alpha/beta hydrolase [Andreprevotia chitinilytica]
MKAEALAVLSTLAVSIAAQAAPEVSFRTLDVDGIKVFYREAGNPAAPTIVLLHGFPSSSHMYSGLIKELANQFHLIAPDYPGSGHTVITPDANFKPSFDGLATVMTHFIQAKGLTKYALYVQDFGGPVGLRIASKHPEAITALIVQNANAYQEGLSDKIADNIKHTSKGVTAETRPALEGIISSPSVQFMYKAGTRDPEHLSPDTWTIAQWGLENAANREIQMSLLADYHTNVEQYPAWQAYFRKHQPPTLVVWGKNDPLFVEAGAKAFAKDITNAEIHLLDTGHFALEEDTPEIASQMRRFLTRVAEQQASAAK